MRTKNKYIANFLNNIYFLMPILFVLRFIVMDIVDINTGFAPNDI